VSTRINPAGSGVGVALAVAVGEGVTVTVGGAGVWVRVGVGSGVSLAGKAAAGSWLIGPVAGTAPAWQAESKIEVQIRKKKA
jgi:hypothetical protein